MKKPAITLALDTAIAAVDLAAVQGGKKSDNDVERRRPLTEEERRAMTENTVAMGPPREHSVGTPRRDDQNVDNR